MLRHRKKSHDRNHRSVWDCLLQSLQLMEQQVGYIRWLDRTRKAEGSLEIKLDERLKVFMEVALTRYLYRVGEAHYTLASSLAVCLSGI